MWIRCSFRFTVYHINFSGVEADMSNRENMEKPDFMSDEEWAWFKARVTSVDVVVKDAQADVKAYLANPDGRAEGTTAQGGFPTLLLTTIGRKSGKKRTTPA